MSENKMSEVAKLLGVELNQEFTIKNRGTSYIFMLTDQGLYSRLNTQTLWERSLLIEDFITGCYQIQKLSKPILDEAEKRYLSNIIKPFRDRMVWIKKVSSPTLNHEYIKICYQDHNNVIVLNFPDFKVGTMYKGMELKKEYTVEQLGL